MPKKKNLPLFFVSVVYLQASTSTGIGEQGKQQDILYEKAMVKLEVQVKQSNNLKKDKGKGEGKQKNI